MNDEILDYYRGLIAGGSDYVGYSEASLKMVVVETVKALPGQSVVELGCGPNPVTLFELARRGRMIAAAELSVDFCETAALNAKRQNVQFDVRNAPAHATPFRDAWFDVAILTEVLEHVPDELEKPTLHELRRILRPGGRLVISVPNAASAFQRYLYFRTGRHRDTNEEHLRDYTPRVLRRRLEDAGFRIEHLLRVPATNEGFRATKAAWLLDRMVPFARWSLKAAFVARR
jgi:SAM-dependent methyltransferase